MSPQSSEESESFQENRMTLRDKVKYLSAQLEKERELRRQAYLLHEEELEKLRREFRQKYDSAINVKQEIIVTLERQLQEAEDRRSSAKEGTVSELTKKEQQDMCIQLQNLSQEYNHLCIEYDKLSVENGDLGEAYAIDISAKDYSIFLLKKEYNEMQEEKDKKILEYEKKVEHMTSFLQKIAHDVNVMKQQASERHMELERLKIQLHEQNSQNSLLVAEVQAEKDLNKVLNSELQKFNNQVHQTEEPLCLSQDLESPKELSCDLQDSAECVPQDPEPVGEDSSSVTQGVGLTAGATGGEENAAVTTKQHSFWKKTRHFLGLRKKNKSPSVVAESGCVSHDSVVAECVSQDAGPLVPDSPSGPENTHLNAGATGGDENPVAAIWKRTRHFLGLRKNKTRREDSTLS